jgi:uncharacterized Zn-binding protein involved in type VI secretion
MPKVCRDIIDLGATGHGCDPVIGVKATQFTVRANNKPILRILDPALPHTIENPIPPCISHMEKVNSCSLTVRANSIGVARVGDSFDMGAMIDGSNNVRAG